MFCLALAKQNTLGMRVSEISQKQIIALMLSKLSLKERAFGLDLCKSLSIYNEDREFFDQFIERFPKSRKHYKGQEILKSELLNLTKSKIGFITIFEDSYPRS